MKASATAVAAKALAGGADGGRRGSLKVLLCQPRGFCAGVDRAIKIVEAALERYGSPVYVRHEIVHNQAVVQDLANRGAVFVEELEEIPQTDAPVIFSAHGVSPAVVAEAKRRGLFVVDAVCPLVSKVHLEARKYHQSGYFIAFIGHARHPEVEGTLGHVPARAIALVESIAHANELQVPAGMRLACLTQTTLSVDDTAEIRQALLRRFPDMVQPGREDICYATTNRQAIVKQVAGRCDHFLVVGSVTSSNSQRLVEVALKGGCSSARLVDDDSDVDYGVYGDGDTVGLSAGASAPEWLVDRVIAALGARFDVEVTPVGDVEENVTFKLPVSLQQRASGAVSALR